eukprot:TRINITY_DN36694_c0_g1_i1.p3 TRINITY_DN36694_c0_g1~~TRINITY_DN36694_c0_g1_i1.p3  ORF type:complete len:105 (-),score=19.51 TRINITY_DN36694_c0_g1_i1:332-646(-)
MDYILLAQRPKAEIEGCMSLNPNEVEEVRWVSQEGCKDFVQRAGDPHARDEAARDGDWISPWFGEIEKALLHPWWSRIRRGEAVPPDGQIHRLKGAQEAMDMSS